ncbi:ATP-binding SpoIIE family protein phosphatase [Streptomyces sp. MSC1_001]|uniref:ATP-binding SpoIIE family protein phosphatase n=1 Tax=Streptomyces sp. MSC1_001 TaxID=2909263 RepID=UPI00202F25E3|nr:SpoIIE family protein phosphatase [Streptomyces sp. MSC1_001]
MPDTDRVAAALLDARGRIVWWSRAAEDLLGWTSAQIAGTSARDLLEPEAVGSRPSGSARRLRLRHSSGAVVEADVHLVRSDAAAGGTLVVTAGPDGLVGWDQDTAFARAVLGQDRIAVAELDMDLRVVRTNAAFEAMRPAGHGDDWLRDLPGSGIHGTVRSFMALVAETGAPVIAAEYPFGADRVLSLTCIRISDPLGAPVGIAIAAIEVTERYHAQQRLSTAYRNAFEIGGSLDVVHSARDLVAVLVPALGDLACVDFPDDVLQGRDPPLGYPGTEASAPRRVAVRSADGVWPSGLAQVGEPTAIESESPEVAALVVGGVLVADADLLREIMGHDPRLVARFMPEGMRSALGCPLYHRGRFFGYAAVYRTHDPDPFDDADIKLMQDLCHRAALAIDNAFQFTREHHTAVVLQRSLLPPSATESAAAETAGTYLPAGGSVSVGGDWFDAFPLSSLRIALVVGDVIGHGLQATATMARLRTAVQTLADLDLPPDELLMRLDDLVQRMMTEADESDTLGASCLFALYDPVTRVCQMASAGHPPPAVVLPDGSAEYLAVVPGPTLGVGDNPFEVFTTTLPPGSVLALYTDGLVRRDHDTGDGEAGLLASLSRLVREGEPLDRIGAELIAGHPSHDYPDDDVTLLLARTRAVAEHDMATWEYPADPAAVHEARADVNARLEAWGLDEPAFATELIVSELVTNALRYAGGPIVLRLIRDRVLVCEVSDPSNTQPRLRRALNTEEGGRGLFLIAQLANRWGCRYGARGKTIWTEQALGVETPPRHSP